MKKKTKAPWWIAGGMLLLVAMLLIGNHFALGGLLGMANARSDGVQLHPLVNQIDAQAPMPSRTPAEPSASSALSARAQQTMPAVTPGAPTPLPILPPDFVDYRWATYSRDWSAAEEALAEAFYEKNASLMGPIKHADLARVSETQAAAQAIDGVSFALKGEDYLVNLPERELTKTEIDAILSHTDAMMSYTDYVSFWFDGPDPVEERISRFLTENEGRRRVYIEDRYQYDGLRPSAPMPTQPGDDGFWYDAANDFVHLTKFYEMTDEQLLQYVDFLNTNRRKPEEPKTTPLPGEFGEDAAVQLAKEALLAMYGEDVTGMEVESTYAHYSTLIEGNAWYLFFMPKHSMLLDLEETEYLRYSVTISPKSGRVLTLFRQPLNKTNDYAKEMGIYNISGDEKKAYLADEKWGKIAQTAVESMLQHDDSEQAIAEVEAYSMFGSNYDYGVEVKVSLSGGAAYVVHISPKTLRMIGLDYYAKGYDIDHLK